MSLKTQIKLWNTSDNFIKKNLYFIIFIIWKLLSIPTRLLTSPHYRSLLILKYLKRKEAHQISNYTEYDRYPELFSICQNLMCERKEIKILSYGCSTGEEVFTLREYFPSAYIIGVDINKQNIKKANRYNQDSNNIFSHHITQSLDENGPFDIIFALAIFQRTENRDEQTLNSTTIYPFEKFNTKITELDSHLKPNGLFVIDHSDYFFEDTKIASHYYAFKGEHNIIRERYMFNKNNQKLENYSIQHRVFIKK